MTLFSFDGSHLKSIDKGFADAYYSTIADYRRNQSVIGNIDATLTYEVVAQVFRCVSMRALEVSRMPRVLLNESDEDVSERPEYARIAKINGLLFRLEAARCLTGCAYSLVESNKAGRNIRLRWVVSNSVRPVYDTTTKELTGFYRSVSRPPEIPLDRIIYLWNPNFRDETRPGIGESEVALGPGSGLHALNMFTAQYFNSGAVKVTVFPVDPSTQQSDIEEFQNWLNRRLSGVKNAFKNIVMRAREKLAPVVIGSDLRDTRAVEISQEMADAVALAHGIPPNVVNGNYKYATADSEYLNFVVGTIVPRVEETFEAMNEQFYSQLGLRLVAQPEKLEVMQNMQLAQVQSVTTAVGQPVLTVNEGRELLGYKPMPKKEEKPISPTTTPVTETIDDEQLRQALGEWRRLAIRAVRAGKSTNVSVPVSIPVELMRTIDAELKSAYTSDDVRAVFERHWPHGDKRDEAMRKLADEIREARMEVRKAKA